MWLWLLRNEHLAVRGRMEGRWTCGTEEACVCSGDDAELNKGRPVEALWRRWHQAACPSLRLHQNGITLSKPTFNKGKLDVFLLKTEISKSFITVRHGGSLPSSLVHQDMTCRSGKVLIPVEIILALGLESSPKRGLEKGMRVSPAGTSNERCCVTVARSS